MFEPNASWSLPAHLFLVSEWSARCMKVGDPFSCTSNIEIPALPDGHRAGAAHRAELRRGPT